MQKEDEMGQGRDGGMQTCPTRGPELRLAGGIDGPPA